MRFTSSAYAQGAWTWEAWESEQLIVSPFRLTRQDTMVSGNTPLFSPKNIHPLQSSATHASERWRSPLGYTEQELGAEEVYVGSAFLTMGVSVGTGVCGIGVWMTIA